MAMKVNRVYHCPDYIRGIDFKYEMVLDLIAHKDKFYILSVDDVALMMGRPEGDSIYVHMIAKERGKCARDAFQLILKEYENLGFKRVYGKIPKGKKQARIMTRWLGGKLFNECAKYRHYEVIFNG